MVFSICNCGHSHRTISKDKTICTKNCGCTKLCFGYSVDCKKLKHNHGKRSK